MGTISSPSAQVQAVTQKYKCHDKSTVKCNDASTVSDCLFTLACSGTEHGQKIAALLFSLYADDDFHPEILSDALSELVSSGTENEKAIALFLLPYRGQHFPSKEKLGQDSLKLYEIVSNRNAFGFERGLNSWVIPDNLLAMAAFEARGGDVTYEIMLAVERV